MGSVKTAKDFLGKEYGPGDTVLYSSGNNMGFGEVARVTERGNVTIYPIISSGYGNPKTGRTIYLDKRTGARVNTSNSKHQARPYGYIHKPTGDFYTSSEHIQYLTRGGLRYWDNLERNDFEYTKEIYKSYVMPVQVMDYPVTIFNTRHILKWEGPVPEPVTEAETSGEAE